MTTQTNAKEDTTIVTSIGGDSNRRFIMVVAALSASFAGFISISGVLLARMSSDDSQGGAILEEELHETPYLAPDDYGGATYPDHYADYYADNDTV